MGRVRMKKEKAPAFARALSDTERLAPTSNHRPLNRSEVIDAMLVINLPQFENEPPEIAIRRSTYQRAISAAIYLHQMGFPAVLDSADFLIFQLSNETL